VLNIATSVIRKADRNHPADAVLRAELKNQRGLSRETGRAVAQAVFAYYRWLGWLDREQPLDEQIRHAVKLGQAFSLEPSGFSDDELVSKGLPDWVAGQVNISSAWIRVLQREPNIWLRAWTGQGRDLAEKLGNCSARYEQAFPDALLYTGSQDLFRTHAFQAGEFELQDISSQAVGWMCSPKPGEVWWDACAGEGGKTLHLADLMDNKGLVWATDRAEWRLRQLKRRAARAQLFNYRAAVWNSGGKLPTKTKFDGVLVDAPCSGLGTWQRNPQARWTTTPQDVEELSVIQLNLLKDVASAVKPGGRLVYSVCTLTRSETSQVARAFTEQFQEFQPLDLKNPFASEAPPRHRQWFWPQDCEGNGMFVAAWQRRKPA
jgi:16S rRNA (cytosine967-C5)-methyltransferase